MYDRSGTVGQRAVHALALDGGLAKAGLKATMSLALDPKTNHLLAALPLADLQRWLPQLEPVEMPLGDVI
ncbi:MAG TPA: hypothetical protein VIY30_14905, partial [Burkholderiaceae bacterium]